MSETKTCGCCGAPVRQTISQGLPSVEYVPPVPDTGDTAALEETTPGKVLAPMDDILDNLLCNLVVADTYLDRDILVADIKAFVAAIVQAERGRYDALLEAHRNFHNTVACPGLPECFVCQLEDSIDA